MVSDLLYNIWNRLCFKTQGFFQHCRQIYNIDNLFNNTLASISFKKMCLAVTIIVFVIILNIHNFCTVKIKDKQLKSKFNKSDYDLVWVSGCVGRTKCWREYKSLRKKCINLISTPIDRYYWSKASKENINFCISVYFSSVKVMKCLKHWVKSGQKSLKYLHPSSPKKSYHIV